MQEVLFQTSLAHITQYSYIGSNFSRINQLYRDFLMSLKILRFFLFAEIYPARSCGCPEIYVKEPLEGDRFQNSAIAPTLASQLP
jgi:hypothetical protein